MSRCCRGLPVPHSSCSLLCPAIRVGTFILGATVQRHHCLSSCRVVPATERSSRQLLCPVDAPRVLLEHMPYFLHMPVYFCTYPPPVYHLSCVNVCMYVCMYMSVLSVCPSSIHPSIIYPSSIHPSIRVLIYHLSVRPSSHPSTYPSIICVSISHPSVCLCMYPSIHPSLRLSAYLSIYRLSLIIHPSITYLCIYHQSSVPCLL